MHVVVHVFARSLRLWGARGCTRVCEVSKTMGARGTHVCEVSKTMGCTWTSVAD